MRSRNRGIYYSMSFFSQSEKNPQKRKSDEEENGNDPDMKAEERISEKERDPKKKQTKKDGFVFYTCRCGFNREGNRF